MKKLSTVWLKSLGLTVIAAVFPWMIIEFSQTPSVNFVLMLFFLLPVIIEILSIVMIFKTNEELWKKIIITFFLPSSIYLYFVILIVYAFFFNLSEGPLFSGWPS